MIVALPEAPRALPGRARHAALLFRGARTPRDHHDRVRGQDSVAGSVTGPTGVDPPELLTSAIEVGRGRTTTGVAFAMSSDRR
jgi:hypothetical protein